MEKWDQYHEDKRIKKKKQDVEMWEETVGEAAHQKIHMKGWFQHFFHINIQSLKIMPTFVIQFWHALAY